MLTAETKKHIDSARQVLVGVVPNPTSQIDQITNALIYKFMDDMDQSAIKQGGEPTFFIGDLEKYAWTRIMDSRLGNQERMNLYSEALMKFSESVQLPELFRDIFKSAFLPYRSPEVLGLFLKEIDYFDYSHSDDLGNAYEYLLSIMSSQGDAGQFRTPRHIIDFIVDVVNPTKDDKVLDPACGTAGFLVNAFNHIIEQHDGKNDPEKKEKPLSPDERRNLMNNFEGYDIDPGMVRIAQVNMYLHQFKNPRIYQYDSLSMEERWNDKFDVILANPPFMSPKGGIIPHKRFSINSSRSEVLFVDYIMNHLRSKGRAGIIVPDGVVTRKGESYTILRRLLVDAGLWAVVDLPAGIFSPYSKSKTSILFIDKAIAIPDVAFAKIIPIQKTESYEIEESAQLNLDQVKAALYQKIGNNSSLNESDELSDVVKSLSKVSIIKSKDAFLKQEYYSEESDLETWGMVSLGQILEKSGEKVGQRKNIPIMSITMQYGLVDQSQKFKKRIANIDISKYKLVKKNELVVGFPIDEGVLGFQTKYDFAAVSPAYDIWRVKRTDLPISYLGQILRSPQAIDMYRKSMKGTANRRRVVPKDVFLSLKVPAPSKVIVDDFEDRLLAIEKDNLELAKKIEENNIYTEKKIAEIWGEK